jgi:hypothetical protein
MALHLDISKQTPVTANRAMAVVSALWNWVAKLEIVLAADNPAVGLEKNKEQGRERFLTVEEFERLEAAKKEAFTMAIVRAALAAKCRP